VGAIFLDFVDRNSINEKENRTMADSQLERAMQESLKAYSSGDSKFFDFLTEDVRVFGIESSEPIIGREAFEEAFRPTFKRFKRKVDIVKQDLQLSGDTAVLSQTLQVTVDDVSSFVRQSVIWEKRAGGRDWRMSHIHNAQVGQAIPTKVPTTAKGVRVLNERIATVAAAVGVAQ
jgi:ketosteroid isomerase-like protein